MDFFNFILNATNEPVLTNIIGKFINLLFKNIGSFGWAVVVFTILLKVALSPLDVWQRIAQRKQTKGMARIQPQLDKLKKQYGSRPDIMRVEQQKLYKQEKISMFGSMLPMIITLVVFLVIFSGFTAMVRYQNEKIVHDLYVKYLATSGNITSAELASAYKVESWLWIKNVFMPDSWANVIPNFKIYAGSGLGAINAKYTPLLPEAYDILVGPAIATYNKVKFFNVAKWNGYLILPILSIILSLVSAKFLGAQQTPPTPNFKSTGDPVEDEKAKNMQNKTMKYMQYLMPLMIGVFAIFYSAAFSIYLFVNSLISTLLSIVMNIYFKKQDKKEKENELRTTFVKGNDAKIVDQKPVKKKWKRK